MNPHSADDTDGPGPGELAAYADSELDRAARARVAAWLIDHPDAAAEVESQREIMSVWHENRPPEPSELQWADTLGHVQDALGAAARNPARRRRLAQTLVALTAVAATLLLGLFIVSRPLWQSRPASGSSWADQAKTVEAEDERLPVASATDVEIVSMNAADVAVLVVGEPPVREPLVLLTPDEITMQSPESEHDTLPARMQPVESIPLPRSMPQPPLSAAVKEP